MNEYTKKNKIAWEYRAYEFWNSRNTPDEKADIILENPIACLSEYHQKYFEHSEGLKIANVCGSNGRKAVPISLLGADVTVFDISEENKKYALELAQCAGVTIDYVLGDFYDVSLDKYCSFFDKIYMEGGILHYFHDLNCFTSLLYSILKSKGELILNDFHPYRKINELNPAYKIVEGNYFDNRIHNFDVAYKSLFPESEQNEFPDCSLRFYTLGEIINAVINAGFIINEYNEHPGSNNKIPVEFTIYAVK